MKEPWPHWSVALAWSIETTATWARKAGGVSHEYARGAIDRELRRAEMRARREEQAWSGTRNR